jgi:outer membrane immunogenic protein
LIPPSQFSSRRRTGGRFVAVVIATLAAAPAAFAADLPSPAPVYSKASAPVALPASWTGFYLGGGVGNRSSQVDGDITPASINVFNDVCAPGSNFTCTGESLNSTGLRFSPYLGYNYQFATRWLAGIEGDAGFGSSTATLLSAFYPNTSLTNFTGGSDSFAVKTGWDASLRGRLGFLVTPSFLIYGTGGAAWQHVDATSTCSKAADSNCASGFFAPSVITDSSTRIGWTIGAGIETMLWHNWIVRGEYRYADFGTISNTDTRNCPACILQPTLTITDILRLKTQTATFGIAYKFDSAEPAFAADLPAPAQVYAKAPVASTASWTGFYLGGGVGNRSSQVDGDVTPATVNNTQDFCVPGSLFTCTGESLNSNGLRFSSYLGYNYQFATRWLAGIEGDAGFGSSTATLTGVFFPNTNVSNLEGGGDTFAVKTGWDASLRGRLGFLVTPSFLIYGTGGAAWQHIDAISTCGTSNFDFCEPGIFAPSVITDSTTKIGWTIGAGVETMLWHNWIVRGEYRYADFGTISNTDTRNCPAVACAPQPSLTFTDTLHLKTQIATFGVAYKFD